MVNCYLYMHNNFQLDFDTQAKLAAVKAQLETETTSGILIVYPQGAGRLTNAVQQENAKKRPFIQLFKNGGEIKLRNHEDISGSGISLNVAYKHTLAKKPLILK